MLVKLVMLQSSCGVRMDLLAGLDVMGYSTILHLCAISFDRLSASTGTAERLNAPNSGANNRPQVRLTVGIPLIADIARRE